MSLNSASVSELIQAITIEHDEEKALKLIEDSSQLQSQNEMGFDVLTLAHQNRMQTLVKALYKKGMQPSYDQFTIMNKMYRVLLDIPQTDPYPDVKSLYMFPFNVDSNNRDLASVSRSLYNGMCYGFSGLYLFMMHQGKEQGFLSIIKDIISWDGEEDTLKQKPDLKATIKQIFDNVFYLSWLNSAFMIDPNREMKHSQFDLHALLNLIKPPKQEFFKEEFSLLFTFTKEEFKELLGEIKHKNKMVRINFGSSHWVCFMRKEDGFHYYNPQSPKGPQVIKSLDALGNQIIENYCSYFRVTSEPTSLFDLGIGVYDVESAMPKVYPDPMLKIQEFISHRGNNSRIDEYSLSGMYNALSLTVHFNRLEQASALYSLGADLNAVNRFGMSAVFEDVKIQLKTLADRAKHTKT